jgi:hypothetical protein
MSDVRIMYQATFDNRPLAVARHTYEVAGDDLLSAGLAHWSNGRLKVDDGANIRRVEVAAHCEKPTP